MQLPDLKELKKLADACRKAGIKHFKSNDFEFTLTDDIPVSNYKKRKVAAEVSAPAPSIFETDTLTEEQLLNWSSGYDFDETNPEGNKQWK